MKLQTELLRAEFPDFPLDDVPDNDIIPPETKVYETSWHNDVSPSWEIERPDKMTVRLWVNEKNPENREHHTMSRFAIGLYDESGAWIEDLFATEDSLGALAAFVLFGME